MFPAFVVGTARVTLLWVVGLAGVQAATSIGRIGLESLALPWLVAAACILAGGAMLLMANFMRGVGARLRRAGG